MTKLIDNLKMRWNKLKLFHKILSICFLSSIFIILILISFNILKPVYVLWILFSIFIIVLMIWGKKGLRF